MITIPFADYSNFQDCINKNRDKNDPKAYCAEIQQQVEGKIIGATGSTKPALTPKNDINQPGTMGQNQANLKSFSFNSDTISYYTQIVETKSGRQKKYFVTGYISTGDVDIVNDIVTAKGMQSLLRQIQEKTITIDYDHETFRDNKTEHTFGTRLPVAKIVDAKIDDRGIFVTAELNYDSPKFKALWNSIKNDFVNAFSIAFTPLKSVYKVIENTKVRLLDDMKLLNVAFTGVPVNPGSVITEFSMKSVILKSLNAIKTSEEVLKMADEETKTDPAPEAPAPDAPAPAPEGGGDAGTETKAGDDKDAMYKKGYKAGYSEGMDKQKKKAGYKAENNDDDDDDDKDEIPGAKKPGAKAEATDLSTYPAIQDAGTAGRMHMKSRLAAIEADMKSLKEKGVFKSVEVPAPVEEKSEGVKGALDIIR